MVLFFVACFPIMETRNFPPSLEIVSPENGTIYNEGEMIYIEALVSDEALLEGGVSLQWQSDVDGLLQYNL
jgi:hypothetical protein